MFAGRYTGLWDARLGQGRLGNYIGQAVSMVETSASDGCVLGSRNVVRVFEFGHLDELNFLTMEFIAGEPLLARLYRVGARPSMWVLEMAVGVCRGLAAALAVGVVHGDIKPGNILLSPGRGGVITEFGIATALNEPPVRDDWMAGTPQQRLAVAHEVAANAREPGARASGSSRTGTTQSA